ncbi:MAG: O-antigen ligase family protein [Alphaproteobacteria bacterium]|nr:O-antigen ligase family protein [Alphaproteobacteria bacterium]
MKWVIFIISVALVFPFSAWLRSKPGNQKIAWVVFGIMPFGLAAIPQLDISLVDWRLWPGYVKGLQFSAQDALVLAMLFALPRSKQRLPFRTPMLLYFGAAVLSVFQAQFTTAAVFYPWQLLRVFLVYFVVARACTDRTVIPPLLTGLVIGLCLQAGLAVYQRYGLGFLQTGGSFGHQNLLGLVSNLVALPLFALLLSGKTKWISLAAPLSACIVAVLATSRATLGLAGGGLVLIYFISVAREMTPRKARIGLAGAILVAALSPIAISSLEMRFAQWPLDEEYDERAALNKAARLMLEDHPLGVGANNYVVTANSRGYLERAGVAERRASRGAPVHNTYWLTAAELGYPGIVTLLFLFLAPLKVAFTCGWRHREDRRGDLLLGLGVSLLVLYVHCYFEWIFFTAPVQIIFAITLGMVAGLAQQLGYWGEVPEHEDVVDFEEHVPESDAVPRDEDETFWGIEQNTGSTLSETGRSHL